MWSKQKTDDGKIFYKNCVNGETSEDEPKEGPFIYHIFIKHAESRSPNLKLSKQEAYEFIKKIHKLLCEDKERTSNQKSCFTTLAKKYSHCSSQKHEGCLGYLYLNQMLKPFEDAAVSLKPGEFSDVVETSSGFHIIFRYF